MGLVRLNSKETVLIILGWFILEGVHNLLILTNFMPEKFYKLETLRAVSVFLAFLSLVAVMRINKKDIWSRAVVVGYITYTTLWVLYFRQISVFQISNSVHFLALVYAIYCYYLCYIIWKYVTKKEITISFKPKQEVQQKSGIWQKAALKVLMPGLNNVKDNLIKGSFDV